MRIRKLKNKNQTNTTLKNHKSPYLINTAKHDPVLPSVFVFCGARGSGKTYSAVALLRSFEQKKYITRTFLISPTHKSNRIFENLSTLDEMDACDDEKCFSIAVNQILEEVEKDWETYKNEEEYKKIYSKHRRNNQSLTFEEEGILEREEYRDPVKITRPAHMVVFDDCQNTSIYSNNLRNNLLQHMTIKHRHIPLSLCFLVQSWAGLPKTVRLNAVVFMLFKTGNKKELYWIWEHFGAQLDYDKFLEVYNYAVQGQHNFLYIDTNPRLEYQRFRRSYNEYIIPDDLPSDKEEEQDFNEEMVNDEEKEDK